LLVPPKTDYFNSHSFKLLYIPNKPDDRAILIYQHESIKALKFPYSLQFKTIPCVPYIPPQVQPKTVGACGMLII